MVIFGASGDLTRRLLVPAMYNLARTGLIPEHFAIIGVDITERSAEDWRNSLHEMLQSFVGNPSSENRIDAIDDAAWQRLTGGVSYVQGDFGDSGLFEKLKQHLADVARDRQTGGNCLFYLAVADRFFGPIVEQLGHAGLLDEELQDGKPRRWRRVVIEKPFGHSVDPRMNSTRAYAVTCARNRSIGSITSSARRRCRTSWPSASPTGCSSRSGIATGSTTCRSPWPRRSASSIAAGSTR
jgi:glucose-6-phosphate 1-dehydrogenase